MVQRHSYVIRCRLLPGLLLCCCTLNDLFEATVVVLVVDGAVGCVNIHYIKLLPLNNRVETHGVHGLQGVVLGYVGWMWDLSFLLLGWYFCFLSEIRS